MTTLLDPTLGRKIQPRICRGCRQAPPRSTHTSFCAACEESRELRRAVDLILAQGDGETIGWCLGAIQDRCDELGFNLYR